mmetsp:Transcript_93691/g.297294  ORF Transcript_93691/g.297294 Transcript_93691/m.297294 type:complete len:372 (-) Transcript_93691:79-1194(-)
MADALELLAKTWRERRVLRGRVLECLRALLGHDAWLQAAQKRSGLCEALAEPLAESPELQARLHCPVSTPATGSSEPKRAPRRPSKEAQAEVLGIRDALLGARDTMRGFDWQFPHDPKSTKLDTATEAFMVFYDGLTRLKIVLRDGSRDGDNPGGPCAGDGVDLGVDDRDWPGVLRFLASMHSCGSRRTYRSRVKFVARRLEELSPGFADAAAAAEREGETRFWSTDGGGAEAASESQSQPSASYVQAEGSDSDEFDSLEPQEGDEPDTGDLEVPPAPWIHEEQFGKVAVHNGMNKELVLYVEEAQRETRVKPGKTAVLEAQAEEAHVRVNFVGLMGFTSIRTRLARFVLRHQNYYSIVKDEHGKTVARVA